MVSSFLFPEIARFFFSGFWALIEYDGKASFFSLPSFAYQHFITLYVRRATFLPASGSTARVTELELKD